MELDNGTSDSESSVTLAKSENFFGLLRDLLFQEVSDAFFQRVLELSIGVTSAARAGSMMVLREQRYHFAAASGYDLQELQKVTFNIDESIVSAQLKEKAFVLCDLKGFNKAKLDVERQKTLQKAIGKNKIRETLVVPVCQEDQMIALLALDNVDNVGVFTKEDVKVAERLGLVLGLGLKLHRYQEKVAEPKTPKTITESRVEEDVSLCLRDQDVLSCICEGLSDKQIAQELGLEFSTTRNYVRRLYERIEVNSRTQAMKWAEEYEWKSKG